MQHGEIEDRMDIHLANMEQKISDNKYTKKEKIEARGRHGRHGRKV